MQTKEIKENMGKELKKQQILAKNALDVILQQYELPNPSAYEVKM